MSDFEGRIVLVAGGSFAIGAAMPRAWATGAAALITGSELVWKGGAAAS